MSMKVTLACRQCHSRNYTTAKTARNRSERLEIKKYCKICEAHTIHSETK